MIFRSSKDARIRRIGSGTPPVVEPPPEPEAASQAPEERSWSKNKSTSEHELKAGNTCFAYVYKLANKDWRWRVDGEQSDKSYRHWRSARKAAESEIEG